jgi:HD-like signal output (HDOD) protein
MAQRRANEVMDSIGQLPVLPPFADELMSLAIGSDGDLRRVLTVVEHDPVLAAMVLRMVNSAAFAVVHEVTDLRSAVVLLGAAHVRSLALAAAMSALASSADSAWEFAHSFDVACTARVLTLAAGASWGETAFAAGILHDIGELIVAAVDGHVVDRDLPPSARLAEEVERIGADHTELGTALAERWSLPEILTTSIAGHHRPWPPYRSLPLDGAAIAAVVGASEAILDELDGTTHSDLTPASEAILSLGASDPDVIILRCDADRRAHAEAMALTTGRTNP